MNPLDAVIRNAHAIRAEGLRRYFSLFVREAWGQVDPAPLVWGLHMDAICDTLQAISDGRLNRVIINVPPGHAKSMLVSVLWPAWQWLRNPAWSILAASHSLALSTRDATKARTLIESDWYRALIVSPWSMSADSNQKTVYKNTAGGGRLALSVGGGNTGFRGECLIIDDPLDASDALSDLKREAAIQWKRVTMATRFNDMERAQEVVIMQRLHEDDLSGYLLREEGAPKWQHLCLPGEFDPKSPSKVVDKYGKVVWADPRKEEGELLFPEKFSAEVLGDLKKVLGSYAYAGQILQRPTPMTGGLLKRDWFQHRWHPNGLPAPMGVDSVPIPKTFSEMAIVADCAFKKTADSDKVAIGVWGRSGPDLFLLDLRWERMSFTETLQAFIDLRAKWPKVGRVLVEDKANGSAVIDVLKKRMPGVIGVEPDGGKESRVAASAAAWEAGNVRLPLSAPWVNDFIEEAVSFPRAPNDDAIDMCAYAIPAMLTSSKLARLEMLVKGM